LDSLPRCDRQPDFEELASEQSWNKAFAKPEDKLAQIADEAIAGLNQGDRIPHLIINAIARPYI